MDQSSVKPHINIAVSIEENMNCRITLCLEHIMIVELHKYTCILVHTKEAHFYLKTPS
jgi:hypothetical protein